MRSRLLCLVLLAALVSCGDDDPSAEPGPGSSTTPTESTSPAVCTTFTPPTAGVEADLDGDGTPEMVALVDEGPCQLLVGRNGTTPLETERLQLDEFAGIRVITLQGTDRQLLLLKGEDQARGGFQPYLIGEAGGVIAVVEYRGESLLPFIATDGGAAPSSARCNDSSGIDLVMAEVAGPAGLAPNWNVVTTSYVLEGNSASPAAQVTDEGIPDEDLRTEQPDLFSPELLLGDCAS